MNKRFELGLTLIELVVSMMISLFIITAAIRLFAASNLTDQLNYQFGLMQQSGRIGLYSISNDIRTAGYTGCSDEFPVSNVVVNTNPLDLWMITEEKIQGISQADVVNMVDPDATSEGIIIFKLSTDLVWNVSNHDVASGIVTFDTGGFPAAANFPVGLIRQDCQQISLVFAAAASTNSLAYTTGGTARFSNCSVALRGNFNCYDGSVSAGTVSFNPGSMRLVDSVVYFIKPDPANGVNTLYRKTLGDTNALPVVGGIENMVIYYGLDSNGNGVANRFVNAGDRAFRNADWQQVTAIRIHLLTQSTGQLAPTPRAYFFDGTTVTPTDRLLRREYVMTIDVRN
ncbi:PilW family protein [Endozoicomonas elysicola]|uniref:Pilus assembly protein PilW n=1 Tax=Endozoicomonas elysicola TaxID=305900 RepID=A0A081KFB3_9GAMM|nr:PilW family protein [Endozoicomonas elysicola]KEI72839.1 hypothetical protein GV64_20820 [Endozoicomonas elysicola]